MPSNPASRTEIRILESGTNYNWSHIPTCLWGRNEALFMLSVRYFNKLNGCEKFLMGHGKVATVGQLDRQRQTADVYVF